mmetsp:Transcript_16278/g.20132  ORF Transcript_16278/g.20132 Transcript_16278/m.20132 type:complete len:188 (-) Transcript_16278:227-790(-)
MTTIQMESISDALDLSPADRKKQVTHISLMTGLEAGAKIGIISVPAVLALTKYYAPFRQNLGVSGRTAMAIIPPLFAFGLVSEQVASRLATPDSYANHVLSQQAEQSKIAIHHRAANWAYDHPVKSLIFGSVAAVGTVFALKGRETHLKFSQRVLHTRVLGQASVLGILVGTMVFHDFMNKRGRYTA